jgi:hypothetical protein
MENMKLTAVNARKITSARAMLGTVLEEVLRRGFHGTARIELVVSDGTVQRLSRTVEQVEK